MDIKDIHEGDLVYYIHRKEHLIQRRVLEVGNTKVHLKGNVPSGESWVEPERLLPVEKSKLAGSTDVYLLEGQIIEVHRDKAITTEEYRLLKKYGHIR